MVHSPVRKPPARTPVLARRVTVALLVAVVVVGGLPLRAYADHSHSGSGDRFITGNGKFNENLLSVKSPEFNHGIQHPTITPVGGVNNIQAAFCKRKFRHCRIVQRFNAFDP